MSEKLIGQMDGTPRSRKKTAAYVPLGPRMALQLAAPHTWPASLMPALVALCAAGATTLSVSISMSFILLVICVLMQASVNTLNDYYDYVKGADTSEDNVDPSDAVLVYNKVNPHAVRNLALIFLLVAFALGMYIVAKIGWIPLAIALVGALAVMVYSAGKTPISYLPLGEVVSGAVMGGLIPLACYYVLSMQLNPLVLVWSIPTIVGVGLIMFTNNTCDIEKDTPVGRHTLPLILGRNRARRWYHLIMIIWVLSLIINVICFFNSGMIILPFMLLAAYPLLRALWKNPLVANARIGAMAQICSLNVALGAFYAAAMLAQQGISLNL